MNIDAFSFKGKKALVRVDFNVPLNDDYHITDDTRMRAALPTIKKILDDGGSAILMSHLGRPKNGPEEKFSLRHLVVHLQELTGATVHFAESCIGEEAVTAVEQLKSGEILLLENTRFFDEEKAGDPDFAEMLAELGEVYVNDAFGTAHRAHASTTVVARYFDDNSKMFGYLMEKEIKSADKVLHHSEKPFTAIIGGAKVSDKILIIENLLDKVNNLIIGGGMAYTFFKAQGGQIGDSLVEGDKLELAKTLIEKAGANNVSLLLPVDSVIADAFAPDANTRQASSNEIPEGWMGLDIGEQATRDFQKAIAEAKTILWNGPMGVFEMERFRHGTVAIAKAVAEATDNGAFSLVGGGDSVAAVNRFKLNDRISYVSTGGGAMLEYFEGKTLPGIAAINK